MLLKRGSRLLHRKLEAELSVHWRQGKPQLPEYAAAAAAVALSVSYSMLDDIIEGYIDARAVAVAAAVAVSSARRGDR